MPTKKPSLFGSTFSEPPKEKKPTLLQYLKTTKDVKFPFHSRIDLIWLPGTFNNFTLETELFRCSVTDRNPLYSILNGSGWGTVIDSETALLLCVMDSTGVYTLEESTFYGKYKSIGNLGVKFEPTPGAN